MKTENNPYQVELAVCTNQKKPGKDCCAQAKGQEILEDLKGWMKDQLSENPELARKCLGKARIHSSGCLNFCSQGTAISFERPGQTERKILLEVSKKDLPELKQQILTALQQIR